MARFFMKLAYNGTLYHGWQKQKPGIRTIQEELEYAFFTITRQSIEITGCGRTDTGVHAKEFFVHFDINSLPKNFLYSLNGILSKEIVIYNIKEVHDDANCRFDAIARTYEYYVHHKKDPFSQGMSYFVPKQLDIALMNKAAKILLDTNDFTSFSKLHSNTFTNNCDVSKAEWTALNKHQLKFEITANRFLRNMVRAIVGTLIQVGEYKITLDEFCIIIDQKNRCDAGKSVDGGALFLSKVTYPYTVE